ncbi:MAG: hypothetical protein BWK78_06420 [Thiotrichaceae bacterium IS1]|nr:MAG: hypothetical protein BWK78_06420 [Thiotrichaceae bacterium IS1]
MKLPSSHAKERPPESIRKEVPLEPKILWPSIEYGQGIQPYSSTTFPLGDSITNRYKNTTIDKDEKEALVYALEEFQYAIMEAKDRLWIMDSNFDAYGVASILEALQSSHVKQIWILTGKKDSQKEHIPYWKLQLENVRNERQAKDHIPADIQWKTGLSNEKYPYLHDRFAIVDHELWHFGATVGGGHPSLNAATRGWDADQTKAITFFMDVWYRY